MSSFKTQSTSPSGDWRTSDFRRSLLLQLKDNLKELTPFAHQKPTVYLTEEHPKVQQACALLEQILLHGIKVREFQGLIPLWGLLERLEVLTPPCVPLRNAVGAIACVSTLRTPLAKARGWVRQTLNCQQLDENLSFMVSQQTWIGKFYYPEAIMSVKEDYDILIAIVRSIKILPFNLSVEDKSLNDIPIHISRYLQQQMTTQQSQERSRSTSTATPTTTNSNSGTNTNTNSTGSSMSAFDSFLRTFEQGLDKFVHQVDNIIATTKLIPDVLNDTTPMTANATSMPAITGNSGLRKRVPFFGSSLKDLLLDETRCAHTNLNPALGIPTQALKLIAFVTNHCHSPNLFRQRASITAVEELRKIIELDKSFPTNLDISAASFVLIHWLNQLPEPLLGYDHYQAIIACQELEDNSHKIRNLINLIREIPWYNKPLLLQVIAMLKKCLQPENTIHNNLNIIACSLLSTPFLLRPYHSSDVMRNGNNEDMDRIQMAATAAGSNIIEFILTHTEEIFSVVQDEIFQKQQLLNIKCTRIRKLQEDLLIGLPGGDLTATTGSTAGGLGHAIEVLLEDEGTIAVLRKVWQLLEPVEMGLTINTSTGERVRRGSATGMTATTTNVTPSITCSASNKKEKVNRSRTNTNKSSTSTSKKVTSKSGDEFDDLLFADNDDEDDERGFDEDDGVEEEEEEREILHPVASEKVMSPLSSSLMDLVISERWQICGFTGGATSTVLSAFTGNDGLIALRCLERFLEKYGDRATKMAIEYGQSRHRYCTLPMIAMRVTHFVAEALQLLPSATTFISSSHSSSLAPIQSLAKQGWIWALLNDENCFQEFFDLTLLCVDEMWRNLTERIGELPTAETVTQVLFRTRSILWDIVVKHPTTIPQIWDRWMQVRLAEEELIFQQQKKSSAIQTTIFKSAAVNDTNSVNVTEGPSTKGTATTDDDSGNINVSQRIVIAPLNSKDIHAMGTRRSRSNTLTDRDSIGSNTISPSSSLATATGSQLLEQHYSGAGAGHHRQHSIHESVVHRDEGNLSCITRTTPSVQSSSNSSRERGGSGLGLDEVSDKVGHVTHHAYSMGAHGYDMMIEEMSEARNSSITRAKEKEELQQVVPKVLMGITTHVRGGSKILTAKHIEQIEAALPKTHQCYDWKLVYRLSMHGASLSSLVHNSKGCGSCLLVVQDANNAIFGALITETLKISEKDKYYGNGTIGVWSFNTGQLKYYSWSYKNSYLLLSTKDCLAFGGGGHFALYLDSDLNHGSSGPCETFNSPCLASEESFQCLACELFALQSPC